MFGTPPAPQISIAFRPSTRELNHGMSSVRSPHSGRLEPEGGQSRSRRRRRARTLGANGRGLRRLPGAKAGSELAARSSTRSTSRYAFTRPMLAPIPTSKEARAQSLRRGRPVRPPKNGSTRADTRDAPRSGMDSLEETPIDPGEPLRPVVDIDRHSRATTSASGQLRYTYVRSSLVGATPMRSFPDQCSSRMASSSSRGIRTRIVPRRQHRTTGRDRATRAASNGNRPPPARVSADPRRPRGRTAPSRSADTAVEPRTTSALRPRRLRAERRRDPAAAGCRT